MVVRFPWASKSASLSYREIPVMFCLPTLLLLMLANSSAPAAGNQSCDVDLVELNHFIDGEGREVFRQLIFYDWSDRQSRYLVRGWKLVKSADHLPRRLYRPERYQCVWQDNGIFRRVNATLMRETWTHHDPEKMNRQWLSEDQRQPLFD